MDCHKVCTYQEVWDPHESKAINNLISPALVSGQSLHQKTSFHVRTSEHDNHSCTILGVALALGLAFVSSVEQLPAEIVSAQ